MKKTLIYSLVLTAGVFLLGQEVYAQKLFRIGMKGGLNYSSLRAEDTPLTLNNGQLRFSDDGAKLGYHLGLFSRINLPVIPLYIQPEALFTSVGGRLKVIQELTGIPVEETIDMRLNRLDIPVIVGLKMSAFRLGIGPVASITLGNELASFRDTQIKAENFTFGFQANAGLDIGRFLLDLKYETAVSNLGGSIQNAAATRGASLDARPTQFILSLGYSFW